MQSRVKKQEKCKQTSSPIPCEGIPPAPADTAAAAVRAACILASSLAFTMFFLYRIRLFPNQLETWETVMPHFLANSSLASSEG